MSDSRERAREYALSHGWEAVDEDEADLVPIYKLMDEFNESQVMELNRQLFEAKRDAVDVDNELSEQRELKHKAESQIAELTTECNRIAWESQTWMHRATVAEAELEQAREALRQIADGPLSKNCGFCSKTTRFNGHDRIANHKDDCPARIAEAALSRKENKDAQGK